MQEVPRLFLFLANAIAFGLSLAVIVPLSLLQQNFQSRCLLYAHGEWIVGNDAATTYLNVSSWGPSSNCVYPQFVSGCLIVAAFFYMAFTLYAVYSDRESTWCATFVTLVASATFAVVQLIASACISGGLQAWCNTLVADGSPFRTCTAASLAFFELHYGGTSLLQVTTSGFFALIKTAEVCSWFVWLICVAATAISGVALRWSERSGRGGVSSGFFGNRQNDQQRLVVPRAAVGVGSAFSRQQGYAAI